MRPSHPLLKAAVSLMCTIFQLVAAETTVVSSCEIVFFLAIAIVCQKTLVV
jgi:hypothetical protein